MRDDHCSMSAQLLKYFEDLIINWKLTLLKKWYGIFQPYHIFITLTNNFHLSKIFLDVAKVRTIPRT